MSDEIVMRLLKQVKSGEVSVEDAAMVLDGVQLSEEEFTAAVHHGVFNEPAVGSIVRASTSPHADTPLMLIFYVWGVFWTLFFAGSLSYGLFNHWDQQMLAFFLGMMMTTLIMMGIIYLRFVMADTVVVKHRRNKNMGPKDSMGWVDYEV